MAQHKTGGPATPQVSEDILRTLLGMSQDVLYAVLGSLQGLFGVDEGVDGKAPRAPLA